VSTLTLSEDHRYQLDGHPIPGVTEIISDVLGPEYQAYDAHIVRAAQRGTAVHLACQLDDEGDLEETSVDPVVLPYLSAWRAFRAESGWVTESAEIQIANPVHWYAGTIDRIGRRNGKRTILDIKTSALASPRWRIQLAAYTGLRSDLIECERLVVQIADNGRYTLIPYTERADWQDWLAIRRVYQLRRRS
jgi:hypothetical protein